MYSKYLTSSPYQLGYKKNTGCGHAHFILQKTINFFLERGSTVNLCSVDISKAYDKLNRYLLFDKLINRGCPLKFIMLLQCWLSKSITCISWNGYMSNPVSLICGVRQGSILSPALFSVYVDSILNRLHSLNIGCHIHYENFNSMMYADDLILCSITLRDMQLLVNACSDELLLLDMKINTNKSCCLRIGNRFNVEVCAILIDKIPIPKCDELSYLGLVIMSGKNLKFNFHVKKAKYYGAINNVLGNIGNSNNASLVLSLTASKCSPILTYNLETLNLSKSNLEHLHYVSNAVYSKIFKTFDKIVIMQCQFYCGYLSLPYDLDLKRLNFLQKLSLMSNSPAHKIFMLVAQNDLRQLLDKYNLTRDSSFAQRKDAIWNAFSQSVNF